MKGPGFIFLPRSSVPGIQQLARKVYTHGLIKDKSFRGRPQALSGVVERRWPSGHGSAVQQRAQINSMAVRLKDQEGSREGGPRSKSGEKAPAKTPVRVVQVVKTPAAPTTEAPTVTTPEEVAPETPVQ